MGSHIGRHLQEWAAILCIFPRANMLDNREDYADERSHEMTGARNQLVT